MGGLSLRNLSFHYRGAAEPALQGLTLAIPRGGIFGLLGPNGAGKTTLISLIAGQLRGAAGELLLDGVPLGEARRRTPHSLGLVPQEQAFYPMLTCRENLRFFGRVQGLDAARLAERVPAVSAFAQLEAVLERRAGELSGGLKRRLNLAIGLLTDPEVVLLDEPTVGVDAQSRAFLLEQIRSLAAPGRLVVYTSHYMEEVQAICDRVAIIDYGRVLLAGALGDVLQDTAGSAALRLSAPLPERLAAEWRMRYELREEGERRYRLRVGVVDLVQALQAAQAAGCEPLAVAYGERDLESVFMRLTDRRLRD
ncbi:MAG TPA: ABC transporter ATP-binding protein [Burkholderiales bacterium]|nr:ABC transporter ATP-binding protein [Burkholderiales bacterium]